MAEDDARGAGRPAVPGGLSREELVALLEDRARAGNVGAIVKLLERPWERRVEEKPPASPFAELDELAGRRAG
ncbi:MAG: hypothetical protein ACR2NB_07520 [Solirubrobacteraceae bacterium]